MNSWVTQCYGYGSTKASSYEKIKDPKRALPQKESYLVFHLSEINSDHESFLPAYHFH